MLFVIFHCIDIYSSLSNLDVILVVVGFDPSQFLFLFFLSSKITIFMFLYNNNFYIFQKMLGKILKLKKNFSFQTKRIYLCYICFFLWKYKLFWMLCKNITFLFSFYKLFFIFQKIINFFLYYPNQIIRIIIYIYIYVCWYVFLIYIFSFY